MWIDIPSADSLYEQSAAHSVPKKTECHGWNQLPATAAHSFRFFLRGRAALQFYLKAGLSHVLQRSLILTEKNVTAEDIRKVCSTSAQSFL